MQNNPKASELLFVYGTLKDPETQQKLIGKILIGDFDILDHYMISESTLIEGIYPILEESEDKSVEGLVIDVPLPDFATLDEYEGESYKRARVRLRSGKSVWVYK